MSELQYREYILFPFTCTRIIFVQIVTITASSVYACLTNYTKRLRSLQTDARVGSERRQKYELEVQREHVRIHTLGKVFPAHATKHA